MKLDQALKDFGLAENEAKIYLATLQLGSASVYKISQKAGLPRPTGYVILERLQNKGLVSTFHKKNILYYNAEDPKKMVDRARQKADGLEDVLPDLRALFSGAEEKPSVRSYTGLDGLKIIYEELLDEADEITGFGTVDDTRMTLNDYFKRYVKRRAKLKMPVRIIVSDGMIAREFQEKDPREIRQTKILPEGTEVHGWYYVWKDKIALITFQNDLHSLIIRNEALAQLIRTNFEVMWNLLSEK